MRFVKTTLMGMGGIAGVALAVLLLVPKAAHAVVATLVQVANTTSNPVPNAISVIMTTSAFLRPCLSA